MKYGLIGERLGHSFSKIIHERIGDYEYELREIAPDDLDAFMKSKDFLGINVTLPYKERVIPYLDEIEDKAREIGAVNTIVNRDGKLCGYNTDFYGMSMLFDNAGIDPCGKKVAILGTGGTSKTATAVLKDMNAKSIIKVSRNRRDDAITYEDLKEEHSDVDIIVNTTPVGMYPNIFDCPVDISGFKNLCGVIDAVYNPINSSLVVNAQSKGISAKGGLYMLVGQAIRASELFLGVKYPSYMTDVIYDGLHSEKENIVLIGMPSSGKSTVGKILAEKIGVPFIDTDDMITDRINMPIAEFFTIHGEEEFRRIESDIIREIAGQNGLVIATGGGAVLKEENVFNLSYNGNILFIDRPLEMLIPTDSRPLSNDRVALENLYSKRYPIYSSVCNARIEANGTPTEIAENILENYL